MNLSRYHQYVIKEYYHQTGKEATVIALGEMAGFPNPITGKKITYIDLLKQEWKENLYPFNGLSTNHFYDFQSLFFQKSSFIDALLRHNPTVGEVNQLLRNAVDTTKEQSFLNHLAVRNRLKACYSTEENPETIHDILKTNQGTIVLRSSLSNDISYKIQENVISVLGSKGRHHAAITIQAHKQEMIEEIIHSIIHNYHLIYALDPSACILEMGITIPKTFNILQYNQDMKIIINCLLDLLDALKYELKAEGVSYITGTTVESNSLLNGQEKLCFEILKVLAEQLPRQIDHYTYETDPKCFKNQGLIGMMREEENQIQRYEEILRRSEKMFPDYKYQNLINEHQLAKECYQKTINQRR